MTIFFKFKKNYIYLFFSYIFLSFNLILLNSLQKSLGKPSFAFSSTLCFALIKIFRSRFETVVCYFIIHFSSKWISKCGFSILHTIFIFRINVLKGHVNLRSRFHAKFYFSRLFSDTKKPTFLELFFLPMHLS